MELPTDFLSLGRGSVNKSGLVMVIYLNVPTFLR